MALTMAELLQGSPENFMFMVTCVVVKFEFRGIPTLIPYHTIPYHNFFYQQQVKQGKKSCARPFSVEKIK